MKIIDMALVGTGGFGEHHLKIIKNLRELGMVRLVAACDKDAEVCAASLFKYGFNDTVIYKNFDELLNCKKSIQLITLCTPIPLHKSMAIRALESGFNVLLEKPPTVTIQDLLEMIEAEKKSEQFLAVSFQYTSAKGFLQFNEHIKSGIIGKINTIKASGFFNRNKKYFTRAPWVGKLKYNNEFVLDGTINNPMSHLLNNCMRIADCAGAGEPHWVMGELYHANAIESEDTSCMRVGMGDITILFYATTTSDKEENTIEVVGEQGWGRWSYDDTVEFYTSDGAVLLNERIEGSDAYMDHYINTLNHVDNPSHKLNCSLSSTKNFVLVSNMAFESSGRIHPITGEYVDDNGSKVHVKDIEEIIKRCVTAEKLYSEMNIPWGVSGKRFNNNDYNMFTL